MKNIVIIAHFTRDFSENDNGRFSYLGRMLSEKHIVEIITSGFYHETKRKRNGRIANWPFKVTFVAEPEYKKNVCLRRFYSHRMFAGNVNKYLYSRKIPDLLYCAVPSLDVAEVAARYAKKNKVPLILDIQDVWPEAFKMVFRVPLLSDLLFYPLKRKADRIYAAADQIIAVSQTYATRGTIVNKKCRKPTVVFLGTDIARFDELRSEKAVFQKRGDEIWLAYIGTLGYSYDLYSVMDAMAMLHNRTKQLRFLVMGDGPLKENLGIYAKKKGVLVTFTGFLEYPQMVAQLCKCDIAVNPIRAGSAGSIINKVGDYAAAGLPVINTQECIEYRKLLTSYKAGINCRNGDVKQLSSAIERLCSNVNMRKAMGVRSRRLGEERFDRTVTYLKICSEVEERVYK